ncbi:MAG TPA: ACT domain-containing protein, partial [Thermoanaerobaculia bacterium]|nr:ACT domain-containing protein [Thermoanaerobaculia bacterium]
AAIASDRAAEIYGARILAKNVEDNAQNFTRFFLAATPTAKLPSADAAARRWKTSLLLRLANRPGSLFRALGAFALMEIDLTKIESRPIEGKPWEYAFYLDVVGNATEEPLTRALENLRSMADQVKVLGTYPTRW